ncbi:MAG: UDP-N-acetylmuramoyl-L-alanyl-D-glutamate--2,6-diaminopimelate ligase [Oscillospiraceae bacterium]|nr:UDP-N-acetylmuramoyl-L-alanyl-D-glutamate--2,6-diaminopimelate ligase [Oscillospiraceae bacterium]
MILKGLLENVNIVKTAADTDMSIHGVCYDSRKIQAGDVFVAVKGFDFDGHKYIGDAVEKGAACVICEQPPEAATPYIVVADSRKALAVVCANWFGNPAKRLKIVGVTGTNGKTTVTTLLKNVLEICTGSKVGLIGTSGNFIGEKEFPASFTTPEAYEIQELLSLMVSEGCEFVVMEVSSHALYLDRVYGMEFEVGAFTNLSQDHLDFHGTMEAYADAKAILFAYCNKSAINIDDDYANTMIKNAKDSVFTYSVNNDEADLVAKDVRLNSNKAAFCALTIGQLVRVEVQIPGMFTVYNALAVLSATLLLGLDIKVVADALSVCQGVKGRAEVVPIGKDFTVLIDYAHTPDALEKIISAVRGSAKGRVVTLFGCGGDRDSTKRPIMGRVAAENSDFVIVTSDNPRTEDPGGIIKGILTGMEKTKTPHHVIENRREAIHWALENAKPDDVLILAGKGHETYQVLGKEKVHFDEREVVTEFFDKRNNGSECR